MTRVLGVGCRQGCSTDELATLAMAVLEEADCALDTLTALATVASRLNAPAVQALAQRWQLPLLGFPAEQLAGQGDVKSPSLAVLQHTGSPSVAEAAALLAAGTGAQLRVSKRKSAAATAALAYA
ncbi:cobalamin biosynthesis protein [uncultured Pseudomonas sp.]|uniref:cobalamin biosynthesis protein n=1 Tax=uncultured Pseudomonas sp. TaxID=114707 RepID=UPI0025F5142D|nr:cobalamin biosynthesis protein [uncultured Pseudomonas sp.]